MYRYVVYPNILTYHAEMLTPFFMKHRKFGPLAYPHDSTTIHRFFSSNQTFCLIFSHMLLIPNCACFICHRQVMHIHPRMLSILT